MTTLNQIKNKIRQKRKKKLRAPALKKCPQKKGICLKIFVTTPKKPNSALRKVVKIRLTNYKLITAHIPGEGGHSLQKYSVVLVRGGPVNDLPGMKYRVIRGKYDLNPVKNRISKRSKYGVKNFIKRLS